jgi:ERCC4-type nuclease
MRVIVDSRESKLLEGLQVDCECEKQFLPLGDIVFVDEDQEIMVERKTWCDLWASIQDGRYREQRSRMVEGEKRVVYVIEGSSSQLPSLEAIETCRRTLLRLQIAYKIPVVYTHSVEDTVHWIRWVYQKQHLYVFLRMCDAREQRIESVQQRTDSKKSSIQNPKTMLVTLFRSISGVSYSMANAMAEPYSSLNDLFQQKQEFITLLPSLTYISPTQKTRKIGPKIAEKVSHLLGFTSST